MQPASLYKFQSSKFALIQLVYQPYPCIKEGPNFFSMGDQISTGNEYSTVNTYALCGLGLVSDDHPFIEVSVQDREHQI